MQSQTITRSRKGQPLMPKFLRLMTLTVVGLTLLAPVASANPSDQAATTREYLEETERYYRDYLPNWEPATIKSTGLKPFMRYKSFMEQRLGNLDDLEPLSRWKAWERLELMRAEANRATLPTWFSLGPTNLAGRILAIEVDPSNGNIVYAGSASGGLWKSVDSGVNWTPMTDHLASLAVSCIEIDADNPSTIWIGTGEGWGNVDAVHGVGILKSTDGGVTWGPTGYTATLNLNRDVFELEYNEATGVLMAACDNGLFRSTDGGLNFSEPMPLGVWNDVELKKGSTSILFAAARNWNNNSGMYRSTDDGLTWTRLTNGIPTTGIGNNRIALTDADPQMIYWVNDIAGNGVNYYRSTDGGDSWSFRSTGNHENGQGWYDLTLVVDPADAQRVFAGGVAFRRSTNGGSTWGIIANNMHVDHHATAVDPNDPSILWAGSDGGVYRSTNSGSTFVSRNTALVTSQFYAMSLSWSDPNRSFGGLQDNGTWRYQGSSNFANVLGADGFECEVGYTDGNLVLAEIQFGSHFRSTVGGSNMVSANSGITEQGPWQTPTHMDYSDQNTIWTAHTSRIYRSTNGGASWGTVHTGGLGTGGRSLDQSLNNPDRVYLVTGALLLKSTDHGVTWANSGGTFTSGNSITDVAVHPDDPDIVLVTLGTYVSTWARVQKTTDGGVTWTDITGNLPGEGAQSIAIDYDNPDTYYLGTDLGVYVSFNAGDTWVPFDVGLPNVVCDDVRWHPDGFLRVATHGRGMWELDLSTLDPSSVDQLPSEPRIDPLTMRVLTNPAADHTSIRYGVREAGPARMALYDATGRFVRTLMDEYVEAEVDFVDVDLSGLKAGVYFARMDSNGASVSRKLVVKR